MKIKSLLLMILIIIKIVISSSENGDYDYSVKVKTVPIPETQISEEVDDAHKEIEEKFPNTEIYGFNDNGTALIAVYSYYYVDPIDGKYYFPEDQEIIDYLSELEALYAESDPTKPVTVPATAKYFQKMTYKYGFIDRDYNIILEPIYDELEAFGDDFTKCRFSLDGEFFIGNQKGENLMETTYDMVSYTLGSGRLGVCKDGKFGYVDEETYEEVIPPVYDLIGRFTEGYAPVILDGELFFINADGEKVDTQMVCDKIDELYQRQFFTEYCRRTLLCETNTEKKIEKYLTCLMYNLKDDPAEITVSKYDFSFNIGRHLEYPFDVYTGDMMDTLRKYSHNPEKLLPVDYDPIKDTHTMIATELNLSFHINYVITDITETQENVYTVTAVPMFMKSPMYYDSEEIYFMGADGDQYFIDSFIPDEIKSTFEERNKSNNYYYDIRNSEEYFAILENECRENIDKYLTYTFTLRITDGGIMYFEDVVQN